MLADTDQTIDMVSHTRLPPLQHTANRPFLVPVLVSGAVALSIFVLQDKKLIYRKAV